MKIIICPYCGIYQKDDGRYNRECIGCKKVLERENYLSIRDNTEQ